MMRSPLLRALAMPARQAARVAPVDIGCIRAVVRRALTECWKLLALVQALREGLQPSPQGCAPSVDKQRRAFVR